MTTKDMVRVVFLASLIGVVVGQGFKTTCFNPFPYKHILTPDSFYSINFTANDDVSLLVYPSEIQNTNIPHVTNMIPQYHDADTSWNGNFKLCLKEDRDCKISAIKKFHVEWYHFDELDEKRRAYQERKVLNVFLKAGERVSYRIPRYGTYCFVQYDYNNENQQNGITKTLDYEMYTSFTGLPFVETTTLVASTVSFIVSIVLVIFIKHDRMSKIDKADSKKLIPFRFFMKLLMLDVVEKALFSSIFLYRDFYEVQPNTKEEFGINTLYTITDLLWVLRMNLVYQFVTFNKPDTFKFNETSKNKLSLFLLILIFSCAYFGNNQGLRDPTKEIHHGFLQRILATIFLLKCYRNSQITEHTIFNDNEKLARSFEISRILMIFSIPILKAIGAVLSVFINTVMFHLTNVEIEEEIEGDFNPLIDILVYLISTCVMCLSNLYLFTNPILVYISLKIWSSILLEESDEDDGSYNGSMEEFAKHEHDLPHEVHLDTHEGIWD